MLGLLEEGEVVAHVVPAPQIAFLLEEVERVRRARAALAHPADGARARRLGEHARHLAHLLELGLRVFVFRRHVLRPSRQRGEKYPAEDQASHDDPHSVLDSGRKLDCTVIVTEVAPLFCTRA